MERIRSEMARFALEQHRQKIRHQRSYANRDKIDLGGCLERFSRKLTEEDRQMAAQYITRRAVEDAELILAMLDLVDKETAA